MSKAGRTPWCTCAGRGRQVVIAHQQPTSNTVGREQAHIAWSRAREGEQVTKNEVSRNACCEGKIREIHLL